VRNLARRANDSSEQIHLAVNGLQHSLAQARYVGSRVSTSLIKELTTSIGYDNWLLIPLRIEAMGKKEKVTNMRSPPLWRMLFCIGQDVPRATASDTLSEIFPRPAHFVPS